MALNGFGIGAFPYVGGYDLVLAPYSQKIFAHEFVDVFVRRPASHHGFDQPGIRRNIVDSVGNAARSVEIAAYVHVSFRVSKEDG